MSVRYSIFIPFLILGTFLLFSNCSKNDGLPIFLPLLLADSSSPLGGSGLIDGGPGDGGNGGGDDGGGANDGGNGGGNDGGNGGGNDGGNGGGNDGGNGGGNDGGNGGGHDGGGNGGGNDGGNGGGHDGGGNGGGNDGGNGGGNDDGNGGGGDVGHCPGDNSGFMGRHRNTNSLENLETVNLGSYDLITEAENCNPGKIKIKVTFQVDGELPANNNFHIQILNDNEAQIGFANLSVNRAGVVSATGMLYLTEENQSLTFSWFGGSDRRAYDAGELSTSLTILDVELFWASYH